MNTMGNDTGTKSQAQQAQDMGDDAASAAQGAIRSTQRATDQALPQLQRSGVNVIAGLLAPAEGGTSVAGIETNGAGSRSSSQRPKARMKLRR